MAQYDSIMVTDLSLNLSKITLDNITSVSLNTDALRDNFEAIVTILKGLVRKSDQGQDDAQQANKDMRELKDKLEKLENRQNNDRKELNEKISNTNSNLQNVQDHTDKNTSDIEKLQESLEKIKDSQNNLDKFLDNNQKQFDAIKERLDDHHKQIQDLYNRSSSSGDDNSSNFKNDLSNVRDDMNDLKNNVNDQIKAIHKLLDGYVRKDEFNPFRDITENKLQSHQESIDDLYNMLKDLNSKLAGKLDCETFDEHINDYANIKNIVINLTNKGGDSKGTVQQVISSGAALSTKDANLLKELGQKFPELEALVKKLQKDLSEHTLNYKLFADETHRKIVGTDENLKNYKVDTNKRLADLEAALKSIRDQILNISFSAPSTSSSSNQGSGSGESSADLRRIQMSLTNLIERVNNLEKEVSSVHELRDKVHHLQDATNEHKHKIGSIEEELIELRALKAKIEMLEQLIKDKEREARDGRSKASRGASSDNVSPGAGVTLDQVRHIVDEEIRKLRDEILAMLDAMRAALDKKAEAEDLWKTEASILERLDQIAGALMKRAQGDKNDTKKALMFLEKKIKEITVVIFGGPASGEEGAILAKKPWTPWSCASCDGKLKEYPGALIDHKHWNKLPQRETSPGRLTQGKFGKGWTKWSETRKTATEKVRDPFSAGSNKGETLPEIHRESGRKEMDSSRMNE